MSASIPATARQTHIPTRASGPASEPVLKALDQLVRSGAGCITGRLDSPARPAQYAPIPDSVSTPLRAALASRGITQFYTHQAEAVASITAGEDVVVVTPTASGKTLCYNVPVIDAVRNEGAKALYLFPTKALSQDQVAELLELNKAADLAVKVFTFDGDTPGDARQAVRKHGDIVVTNPDMLHQGILPHHTRWARFFESLRYVVIDEAHIYRGVFGAHVANVMRRLLRLAAFYGAHPQFILCSATIGNPGELSSQLIGRPVRAITRSGAPQGPKTLLLWNPPVVNPDLGIRASARSQTARIARTAVAAGARSIVFAKTRTMVEVLTRYLKDAFDADTRKPARVRAYRGGYLPNERRDAERALRDGRIDCVVSTSALELGVDIGALDVCVLNGYPGTIAGTWQRLGRAGRRQKHSLGVLVASSEPLDQYVVRHPEFFMDSSPENARIAPDQALILLDHIRCAAFELPFQDGELFGNVEPREFLEYLQDEQVLHHESGRWHWMTDSYPANAVSLRRIADGNFVVVDITDGQKKIIAEVDYAGAAMTIYEGAIYQIQARPWQVETLDWEGRKAFVRETRADYYTEAIDYTRLKVLETFDSETHSTGNNAKAPDAKRSGIGRPGIESPSVESPSVEGPGIERSSVESPKVAIPGVKSPGGGSPSLESRGVDVSGVDLPGVDVPGIDLPDADSPDAESPAIESLCGHGEVHVIRRVAGYKKIRFYTHENIGYGDVELPDHEMHTTAVWWRLSPGALEAHFSSMSDALDGFQGAAYALHHSAVLATMTEAADIGRAVGSGDGSWVGEHGRSRAVRGAASRSLEEFEPVIFLYDSFPGGMGIAEPLYQRRHELLERALSLISRCECVAGCPACVGPQLQGADNAQVTPKQFAVTVLGLISHQRADAAANVDAPATLQ